MKSVFLVLFFMLFSFAGITQPEMGVQELPSLAGQRNAFMRISFGTERASEYQVFCYYSNNRASVQREDCASAEVKRHTASAGNNIRYEMIFPHADHPRPNRIALTQSYQPIPGVTLYDEKDNAPVIYYSGDSVFCKWVVLNTRSKEKIKTGIAGFKMPRFFIIAYAGDSYAAGEGAPDDVKELIGDNSDMWIDDYCHRSGKSGGIQGIKRFIIDHPEYAVKYANVTCSGAEIDDFISTDIRDDDKGRWSKLPQLVQIKNWLQRNNRSIVDVFLFGAGGNDAGFGPIGVGTLLNGRTDMPDLREMGRNGVEGLSTAYAALNSYLVSDEIGFSIGKVMVMGYPDPTRQSNGSFCIPDPSGESLFDCWGFVEERLSREDFKYIYEEFVVKINNKIKEASGKYDWKYIDVQDKSRRNGLCNCDEPYFNTLGQSFFIQGDQNGTLHPNAEGYDAIYKVAVADALTGSIRELHEEWKNEKQRTLKEKMKAELKAKMLQTAEKIRKEYAERKKKRRVVELKPLPSNVKPVKPHMKEEYFKKNTNRKSDND